MKRINVWQFHSSGNLLGILITGINDVEAVGNINSD